MSLLLFVAVLGHPQVRLQAPDNSYTSISDSCFGALVYCQATLATLRKTALSKDMYLVPEIALLTFPRRACFQPSAPNHGQTSVDTTAVLYQNVPVPRVSFDCENSVAPQVNTSKYFTSCA